MFRHSLCVSVAVLCGACQFSEPADIRPFDAAIDARLDVVTGQRRTTWVTLAGSTTAAHDLSGTRVRALLPDETSTSGFRVVPGTGDASGNFAINGVPPGISYLLAIDDRYWVTSARTVDLRDEFLARPTPGRALAPTPVSVQFDGLIPFAVGLGHARDQVLVSSTIADAAVAFTATPGAVAVDQTLDWENPTGQPLPLIDTSLGDDAFTLQSRARPSPTLRGAREMVVIAGTTLAGVSLRSGEPAELAATLHGPSAPRLLSRLSRSAYDAVFDRDSYGVSAGDAVVAPPVLGLPFTGVDPLAVAAGGPPLQPVLAAVNYNQARAAAVATDLVFADPLPPGWPRLAVRHYTRVRRAVMPGAQSGAQVPGGLMEIQLWEPGAPTSTGPGIVPPRELRVAGVDGLAGGAVRRPPGQPLALTWGAVARAGQYQVTVFRARNDGARTFLDPIAALSTAETSVSIPAEALGAGEYVAFSVAAIDGQNRYGEGDLLIRGLPLSYAAMPSGLFRLSASCGDGRTDPGEDCDGVTASCDVDCTTAVCGDGLVNAMAGEACDSGGPFGESPGCDRDCTPALCGDGRVNSSVEQCDDGNARDDNNGCSETCLFNNVCGDGVVQLGEACDPGREDGGCDADCTLRTCGDGYANTAAGEQCDDGGTVDGDGCTTLCDLEPSMRPRSPFGAGLLELAGR